MDNEKKKEICDRYANWVEQRSNEGIMVVSPYRLMTFVMWLSYNEPSEKDNAEELHEFFCTNYEVWNVNQPTAQ